MEINANNNVDVAQRVIASPTKSRPAPTSQDSASFNRAQAIEQSLQATPAVRSDVVARAQELVTNVKYPPAETINGIAALLALKLNSGASA